MTYRVERIAFASNAAMNAFLSADAAANGYPRSPSAVGSYVQSLIDSSAIAGTTGRTERSRPHPSSGVECVRLPTDNTATVSELGGATPYTYDRSESSGALTNQVAGRAVPSSVGDIGVIDTIGADFPGLTPRRVSAVAGQSNAKGASETVDDLSGDVSEDLQWGDVGNARERGLRLPGALWPSANLTAADEPLKHPTPAVDQIGFACAAIRARKARAGDDEIVVPVAYANTGFAQGTWSPGGSGITALRARWAAALNACQGNVVGALYWHQGERDAADGVTGAAWTAYMVEMVSWLRAEFGNFPLLVGGIVPSSLVGNYVVIQAAIEDLPNHIDNCAYVSSAGLSAHSGPHFYAADYRTFGARYDAARATLTEVSL